MSNEPPPNPGSIESTAVDECRRLFLFLASRDPTIRLADSLQTKVLIPTSQLREELGLPVPNLPVAQWETAHWQAYQAWSRERERLLREWAVDLNLNYEWVLSEAAAQLTSWGSFPENRGAWTAIPGYPAPVFFVDPWFFEKESEALYRRRMKTAFSKAIESHIRDVGALRSKLLPDRGSQQAHYRWAAEHVCLKRTWADIAKKNGVRVTPQAVRKAVLLILRKIEIPETTT